MVNINAGVKGILGYFGKYLSAVEKFCFSKIILWQCKVYGFGTKKGRVYFAYSIHVMLMSVALTNSMVFVGIL